MGQPGMVAIRQPAMRPWVTYTLMGICGFVFLLQMLSQFLLQEDIVWYYGAKINEFIRLGQLWRLITPMFLHASIVHIGFNMYALYNFGPGLERHYGRKRFLVLFLLGGFAGNVISFMFTPDRAVGSSTAIFGLLGAEAVFLYQNRQLFGGVAQRALMQVVSMAVVNLIIGLSPGIDNWGHIGGLLGGTLFAWFAGPLLQVSGIPPELRLIDRREPREVIVAGLSVAALFSFLTMVVLFVM